MAQIVTEKSPKESHIEKLSSFCEQTTIHGFAECNYAKRGLRPFWLIAVGGSFLMSFVMIGLVIKNFRISPTVTSMSLVGNFSMEFPKVIVCLKNPFDGRKVRARKIPAPVVQTAFAKLSNPLFAITMGDTELLMSTPAPLDDAILNAHTWDEVLVFYKNFFSENPNSHQAINTRILYGTYESFYDDLHTKLLKSVMELGFNATDPVAKIRELVTPYYVKGRLDMEKLILDIAFDSDHVIKSCLFGPTAFDCAGSLQTIFDTSYGVCYGFKTKFEQNLIGIGLAFQVNTLPQYAFDQITPTSGGVQVMIAEAIDPSSTVYQRIPTGVNTQMVLSLTEYDLQVKMCTHTDRFECFQRVAFEKCKCIIFTPKVNLKVPDKYPFCDYEGFSCITKINVNETKNCAQMCKPQCMYRSYQTSVTYFDYPSPTLSKSLGRFYQMFPYIVPGSLNFHHINVEQLAELLALPALAEKSMDQVFSVLLGLNLRQRSGNDDLSNVVKSEYHALLKEYLLRVKKSLDGAPALQELDETKPATRSNGVADYAQLYKQSNVLISIAFKELSYTKIKESFTMTWDGFVAQIGGQLGLFMGASVISILHLFMYLGQLMHERCLSARRVTDAPDEHTIYGKDPVAQQPVGNSMAPPVVHDPYPIERPPPFNPSMEPSVPYDVQYDDDWSQESGSDDENGNQVY